MIRQVTSFAWRIIYARYLFASAVALGVDLTSFFLLLNARIPPVSAAVTGYILGLCVHWLLSSRLVFARQATRDAAQKWRQKLLFVVSALVGLAITTSLVGLGHERGFDPRLAKLVAVAISFQVTYILRRTIVFA